MRSIDHQHTVKRRKSVIACIVSVSLVAGAFALTATASEEIAAVRPQPLRDLPPGSVLQVADFGAIPDDGQDDLPAIQAAIEKARGNHTPVRILLGRGRFDLHPTGDGGTALLIAHQENLILDGDGARLVIHNPKMGLLSVSVSKRVIVRNLSVDYDPLPTTQGLVTAVDAPKREFEVAFGDGVDLPDREHFLSAPVKWGIFKDRSRPRALKPGSHNMCPLDEWQKVAPRRFRYRTAQWYPMDTIQPGDPFVQLARVNTSPIVSFWRSEDVTVDRVRVFASPGAGFVAQLCTHLNLLGVHVEPAEGRWQCLSADGFYCIANRTGPWIEGCVFDATGDDCIVVKTWGASCVGKTGPRTILLEPRPTWREGSHVFDARVGDTIRVCDPTPCEQLTQFKIVQAERVQPGDSPRPTWRITADRDLDTIEPGSERGDPIYYNDDVTSGNFIVRDNTFRNVRRWGLVCMSHDGLIEGNTFGRTSAQAILFTSNDAGFRDSDGFVARNVTVRQNTFDDCYTQRPAEYRLAAAAVTSVVIAGVEREFQSDIVEWRGHENLVIDNNRFSGRGTNPAIWLGNVSGATVRDNVFEVRPVEPDRQPAASAAPRIRIGHAADVKLSGNRQQGAQTGPIIDIDGMTTQRIDVQ